MNKVLNHIDWKRVGRLAPAAAIIISALIIGLFFASLFKPDNARKEAVRVSKIITERMDKLGDYMQEAMHTDPAEWPVLKGLPADMVVYRYIGDSLQSWRNQFTLDNDDLSRRVYIKRLTNLRSNISSPLNEAGPRAKYMNIGQKWYVVKAFTNEEGITVIGGLEIRNTFGYTYNGTSEALRLSDRYAIYPISYGAGATVYVEGAPMMKIIQENRGLISSASELFSPSTYAGGNFFVTLGSLLIINIIIVAIVLLAFVFRIRILKIIMSAKKTVLLRIYALSLLIAMALILVYTHFSFISIITNSNINLELYKVIGISRLTVYIYLSYLSLLITIPMLLQMLSPVFRKLHKRKLNVFSRVGKVLFSFLMAVYVMSTTSMLSFTREDNKIEIWASRLAVDRDLGFEIRLREAEYPIASDQAISYLIGSAADFRIVLNRITETYLNRISDYDINMSISKDSDFTSEAQAFFQQRLSGAKQIYEGSHFWYSRSSKGRPQYTGVFFYYSPNGKVSRLILAFDAKVDKESLGYDILLGRNTNGGISLPPGYSYGKYFNGNLVDYKGEYAYPTTLTGRIKELAANPGGSHTVLDKYLHFINPISDDECIVISRERLGYSSYIIPGLLIMVVSFFCLSIPVGKRRRSKTARKNYYKSRINTVVFISLLLTLVAMSVVSILFVYKRNESGIKVLTTGKINTIQSLLEAGVRYFNTTEDLNNSDISSLLDNVSQYTKSDITLYTPKGKVFVSTYPEIFERMALGSRLNEQAFRSIIYHNMSFYIHKENIVGKQCYTMYAPIFNDKGKLLAIAGAPYTDAWLNLKVELVFHIFSIITVFLLLLLLTRIFTIRVVDKMFSPLQNMGAKMNMARTKGLEYIIYDRDDEIASLVRAYNLMVHDLSESSKQAAQIERDKAWSEMARQVAHEIKNPLTPIKLQIQRIIRLKAKNSPDWEEKFDKIVPVIMDSIDNLTDTANEFSTFAKLYSEENVDIDLDLLLKDQILLFDDRDKIRITYMGLQQAFISGPKPQLTRVFVNLLTNAVQAIANGNGEEEGKILVSLRNSNKEGFYDIVVEDNGPGVKDEYRNRLFTPNFTTKSSGTGLGLAICKNIVERCGGEIFYSSSFSLRGACFTIRFPKKTISAS